MDPTPISDVVRDLVADAVRVEVEAAVEAALHRALPDVIRRAALPPYLTKQQLMRLTGWSARKVEYAKAQRRIPFLRRGRTVLFPTHEVEAYLAEGLVPPKDAACGGKHDG